MAQDLSSPFTYGSSQYTATVNSVRHYLRNRDFLSYAFQLIPEPVGSETWSLALGYVRQVGDIISTPTMTKSDTLDLLQQEREVVELGVDGDLRVRYTAPVRHSWLAQFFDNERKYYEGEALQVAEDLFECAWSDVERKGRFLSQRDMGELLYNKTRNFFKLYFILGDFDLEGQIDNFSDLLGMGLGMLDDVLNMSTDYESGYVNITREEMESLGIDFDPEDQDFLQRVMDSGYRTLRAKKIMSVLLRARRLTRHVRVPLVRALLLRLTEIFAAPILDERFIPGQRFFLKGRGLVNRLLPKNESLAYRIGHKIVRPLLMYPQLISFFFRGTSTTEDKHPVAISDSAIGAVRTSALLEDVRPSDDPLEVDFQSRITRLLESITARESGLSTAELAARVTTELHIEEESKANQVYIEAGNVLRRDKYTHVPIGQRILLIPHCLRDSEKCQAPVDDEGYHCVKCGACVIADITRSAEERGLKWYMVGGGSHAIRIIKNARPQAVLGVACFDEAMMAIEKISEYGIPTQAVLLSKDGCVNTEVDLDSVRSKIDI